MSAANGSGTRRPWDPAYDPLVAPDPGNGRDYAPCALNRCLTDLPPERVVQAVHQLLAHLGEAAWPS